MARQHTLRRRLFWGILGYGVTTLGALGRHLAHRARRQPARRLAAGDRGRPPSRDHRRADGPCPGRCRAAAAAGGLSAAVGVSVPTHPVPVHPIPFRPVSRAGPAAARAVDRGRAHGDPAALRGGRLRPRVRRPVGRAMGHRALRRCRRTRTTRRRTREPSAWAGRRRSTEGVLTVSVSSVRVNDQVTMITVHATNTGDEALNMPLYGNTQLTVPGATTLQPDPFTGSWPDKRARRRRGRRSHRVRRRAGAGGHGGDARVHPDLRDLARPQSISVDIPIVPAA